ncbi:serine/threonine-protein kinase [Plantactinospora sonchi]|uniref:non-specific serine/threonine protein kinase n=1 Tax=Plantactinospora sonchi TaxID=1544735 RepID=A0ABU7RTK5_9ACTN
MLESGVVLGGRYRLDERVATGGMGDVWRGTDVVLGRQVAVKVLLPALLADPGFIARFRAEARMLAALRHPGIVQVYDYGEDNQPTGRADYLVMEYVDGEPLSERIRAAGRLGLAETLRVVAQVAQALHAAHLGGIVHRDVKPSNLLVQADGTVRLLDFGVARSVEITSITSSNAVPGTALYMAPEQAAGRPVSAATDIYALGAVAYQCVAGDPPFTGDTPLQVAVKHLHDEPAPLPDDVPEPVTALIGRALSKDPADRYPSAAAFARAARAAASHPTVVAAGAAAPAVVAVAAGDGDGEDAEGVVAIPGGTADGVAVSDGVGGTTTGGGSGRMGQTTNTLADNPVVPLVGDPVAPLTDGRPERSGVGPLTLAGVAGAVGVVAAAVTALIAFQLPDGAPATNPPASPTATAGPSEEPSHPEETKSAESDGENDPPVRPNRSKSPTPTPSPSASSPDTEPGGEPTVAPTTPAEPTEPPATTPAGPADPPSGGVDPDQD